MAYVYKPDISVKFSPRVTRRTKRMVNQICMNHELFEADVLRFCLEAAVTLAEKRGTKWITQQIPGFDRKKVIELNAMFTVTSSKRTKAKIDNLILASSGPDKFKEPELLRYLYDYILPIALEDGFGKIMDMRERRS